MIVKKIGINYLPIKTYFSIEVEAASQPVQEFDAVTGEYYPDRTLVPLVLTPKAAYFDPNDSSTTDNAAPLLTDGHWYRIDNTTGATFDISTEISSGSDYVIDTVAGSPTYGRISIKENVNPGNPVTYVFRATLVHPNGERVPMETHWQARTRATETVPVLGLDNAAESLYNPWGTEDEFPLNPTLRPDVPGTTYAWESCHSGVWGALGSTPLDWAVTTSGNGVKVKRSVMQDRLDLRCVATIPAGAGKTITETVTASLVRRLPAFRYDFVQAASVNPTDTTISPSAIIKSGRDIIADPGVEVDIVWRNASGTVVGRGMRPVIPLSSLGAAMEIGLDITDAGGWKALTDSDGAVLTDSSGAVLIVK